MEVATKSVPFNYDNNIYQQIDVVAMGSPLRNLMANIFVRFNEKKLFHAISVIFMTLLHFFHRIMRQTGFFNINIVSAHLLKSQWRWRIIIIYFSLTLTSIYRNPFVLVCVSTGSLLLLSRGELTLSKHLLIRHWYVRNANLMSNSENLTVSLSATAILNVSSKLILDLNFLSLIKNKTLGPLKCPIYMGLPWNGCRSQLRADKISSSAMH